MNFLRRVVAMWILTMSGTAAGREARIAALGDFYASGQPTIHPVGFVEDLAASRIRGVHFVERDQLDKVRAEIELWAMGGFDADTLPPADALAGATHILTGEYQTVGTTTTVVARVYGIEGGKICASAKVEGSVASPQALVEQLAKGLERRLARCAPRNRVLYPVLAAVGAGTIGLGTQFLISEARARSGWAPYLSPAGNEAFRSDLGSARNAGIASLVAGGTTLVATGILAVRFHF